MESTECLTSHTDSKNIVKMEKAKYILLFLVCIVYTGCMDGDWEAPAASPSPYGNSSIQETNVITIAELKNKYSSVFNASTDQAVKVDEDIQIKAFVTGNDIAGNIYQQVSVQDETGAILIGISQGGLMGYLPLGQEILVNLKGLYVGSYRKQCQIGAPYNNGIGRMDKFTWQEHFKPIGSVNMAKLDELKSDFSADMDMFENCAKLMTFHNVTLSDADGHAAYAPNDGSVALTANCANRNLEGVSNVVVRTSTYADFAAVPMPTGKVDITGIFTRYNNTWQILLRTDSDINKAE